MSIDFIKKSESYSSDVEELIIEQFKDKEKYKAFVATISDIQQDFQNILVDLAEGRRLPLAVGQQLTDIGEEQGIVRTTDDDNDFRIAIYLSSIRKQSDGTRDVIVQGLITATGESPYIYLGLERQVCIYINGDILPSQETLNEVVGLLPVNTAYEIFKTPTEGFAFGFDNDTTAKGFGSEVNINDNDSGGLSSLRAYVVPTLEVDNSNLPYVATGYVEEGYVS